MTQRSREAKKIVMNVPLVEEKVFQEILNYSKTNPNYVSISSIGKYYQGTFSYVNLEVQLPRTKDEQNKFNSLVGILSE